MKEVIWRTKKIQRKDVRKGSAKKRDGRAGRQ